MVTQRDLDRTIVYHDQRSSISRWPMRGRTAFVMPSAAKTRTIQLFHQMLELYVIRFTDDGKYLTGQLEPDRVLDYHRRKVMAAIGDFSHRANLPSASLPRYPVKTARAFAAPSSGATKKCSTCIQEREVRIQFPPADSLSLSGFRLHPRRDPGFAPFWRPCGVAASAETPKTRRHRAKEG